MPPKISTPAIPDPYSVDYAPTGRATCKDCNAFIKQGSVRFARKVRSPFHDGFDTQYRHLRCGVERHYTDQLEELKGLFALRWSDIELCAGFYNVQLDQKQALIKEYKRRNEMMWELQTQIDSLPIKILKPILEFNGIHVWDKMKSNEAAHVIADGLLFGKLPNCPICESPSLRQEGTELHCRGFLEGSNTRCPFKYLFFDLLNPSKEPDNSATGINDQKLLERVEKFLLPPECMKFPGFKNWKCPKDAPSLKLSSVKTSSSSEAKSEGKPKAKGKKTAVSDDEIEEVVPKGWEFVGMSFSSVGATNPSKQELIQLVVDHKGQFTEDVTPSTSYLLIGDDLKARSTKRFSDAKTYGVPVLHCDFITALLSRTPKFPKPATKKRAAPKAKLATRKRTRLGTNSVQEEKDEKGDENNAEDENEKEEDPHPKGVILRQRKYAKYYLLHGKMSITPFPSAKILKEKQEALNKIKKEYESDSNSLVNRKRPPVQPGSVLLKIDDWFPKSITSRIYVDAFNNVYNCTTLYSDISTGINKFYNLQLIENPPKYCIFRKWGRIGKDNKGNDHLTENFDTDLKGAITSFEQRCFGLTGIDWNDRFNAKPVGGRYRYLHLEGYAENDEKNKTTTSTVKVEETYSRQSSMSQEPESKLSKPVQSFIELIFNREMMENALEDQDFDLQKMPLGAISRNQMNEGYSYLRQLQGLLTDEAHEAGTMKWAACVLATSNKFYTAIPHVFKLSRTPPPINTLNLLKQKIDLMEQLMEIKIAASIMDEALRNEKAMAALDGYYLGLKCDLKEIDHQKSTFKTIALALKNTHAVTHNSYSLNLIDIYECNRHNELERYQDFLQKTPLNNRKLLWHGSRLTNWAGILRTGLRIAPPEAPVTGYMFGKGIYFADMVSKSSNYCFADQKNPYGVLVLCEVALGKPYHRIHALDSAAKACKDKGCNHTWGIGGTLPNPSSEEFVSSPIGGVEVPIQTGKGVSSKSLLEKIRNEVKLESDTSSLLYNEYIVYDEAQVLMRYILRIEFNFKSFLIDEASSTTSSDSESDSS